LSLHLHLHLHLLLLLLPPPPPPPPLTRMQRLQWLRDHDAVQVVGLDCPSTDISRETRLWAWACRVRLY
jgi:hypothetical protein